MHFNIFVECSFSMSVFQLSELLFIFKRNLSCPLLTWNCNCSVDLCFSLNKGSILYDSGIKTKNAKLLLCHNSKLSFWSFLFFVFILFLSCCLKSCILKKKNILKNGKAVLGEIEHLKVFKQVSCLLG